MTIENKDLFEGVPGKKRGGAVDKKEYLKDIGQDTASWWMGENPKLKPKPQEEGVFYKSSFAFSKTKLEQKLLGFKPTDPPTQGMLIGRAVDITFRTMIILKEVPELFGLRLLDVDKILTETFNISEKRPKKRQCL